MLPKIKNKNKNQKPKPTSGPQLLPGGPAVGRQNGAHRLVSSALGTLYPLCLGNLACRHSTPGIIPLEDLPICPAEKMVSF